MKHLKKIILGLLIFLMTAPLFTLQADDGHDMSELAAEFCTDFESANLSDGYALPDLINLVNRVAQGHENDCQRQILYLMKSAPGRSQEEAEALFYLRLYEVLFDECPHFTQMSMHAFGTSETHNPALEAVSADVDTYLSKPWTGSSYQEHMNDLLSELDIIFATHEELIMQWYPDGIEDAIFQRDVAGYLLVNNAAFAKLTVLKVIQQPQE
ncbi:MAG: hypothetical protein KDC12_06120 [Flavobacteriales bacterium]|nr:hypothetical protein [Flavobacteriales bacterium]